MKKDKKKVLFAAWSCHNKNYFAHQTWYGPLKKIFSDIKTFDPQETIYLYGKNEMNKQFLEVIRDYKPDFVFLWLIYDEFDLDTLLEVKKVSPQTKIINYFGDDDTMFNNFTRYYSQFVDYCLASHKNFLFKYNQEGIKNIYFSCAVDTKSFHYQKIKKEIDVSFIGLPKSDRYEYIKFLIDNKINVSIYGSGWDDYADIKPFYKGKLSKEESVEVMNKSKINLSFTKNYYGDPSFKSRILEICACNSFLLSEYFFGYKSFLKENKELVMFKNKEDLLEKVNYYLKNEKKREEITKKAYKIVVKKYNKEKEFNEIFKNIFKNNNKVKNQITQIREEVIYLDKNDINKDINYLRDKINGFNYIGFKNKDFNYSSFKKSFQIYSLKKSKKEISCCDYYISSKSLGDILALQSFYAFKTLKEKDFLKVLDIGQLMVRKDYFLDNLEKFKNIKNQPCFISEINTAFVSVPLIKIKKIKNIGFENLEKVLLPLYETNLRSLKNQKKVFVSGFTYKLIVYGLFINRFIFRSLLKKNKNKGNMIKKYILRN